MSCAEKRKESGLLELIAWGRKELLGAGIDEAQEECERILMKLLGCKRSGLYLGEHEMAASGVRGQFLTILEKRISRKPLAYLLNEADFWQETLYVDERCLIPRPETEILVEQVLKAAGERAEKEFSFLDIGTGSGAIAIAILRELRNSRATLLDISKEALEVARKNLERYVLGDRVSLIQGNLFEPFSNGEKWDLIISNPPYLSKEDWKGVQEELSFEPRMALDGGEDGLDFYRKIVQGAKGHLSPGGLLALEVGQGQADMVSKWLQEAGYDNIQRFNDHLRVQRVVTAQRHS
ncbi:MAG: peptide chain release factor N(5)-glutamine methyltransferase [Candidatus Omnitrophota bacterium]